MSSGYRVFSPSKSRIFQTRSFEIESSSGSSSKRITQCRYDLPINANNSNARCSRRGYSSSINLINRRTAVLSLVWLALIGRPPSRPCDAHSSCPRCTSKMVAAMTTTCCQHSSCSFIKHCQFVENRLRVIRPLRLSPVPPLLFILPYSLMEARRPIG